MRFIFPEREKEHRWEYAQQTTEAINAMRERQGNPHLIHVALDRYASGLHRFQHKKDSSGKNIAGEAKDYRGKNGGGGKEIGCTEHT